MRTEAEGDANLDAAVQNGSPDIRGVLRSVQPLLPDRRATVATEWSGRRRVVESHAGRVVVGQGVLINPEAGPDDNGSVESIDATILPATYTGDLNANPVTAEISVGAAAPVGTYTVSVTVTDNCGTTAERDFALDVVEDGIFADGFETP